MTIQVTPVYMYHYEIDFGEKGEVLACFRETITILRDEDGKKLAQKNHRDVITLGEFQAAISKA